MGCVGMARMQRSSCRGRAAGPAVNASALPACLPFQRNLGEDGFPEVPLNRNRYENLIRKSRSPGLRSLCLALMWLSSVQVAPLKIAYSDWLGWVAWKIGISKGWFKETGVDVEFLCFDDVASMDAYVAGQVDAVCLTSEDALVAGTTGKPSVGILINDYSNGNDMLVAVPGIESPKDLKGKKVGVEEGFFGHLLLNTALETAMAKLRLKWKYGYCQWLVSVTSLREFQPHSESGRWN